jgi:transcriptional regulator with XRE-family HTH domain
MNKSKLPKTNKNSLAGKNSPPATSHAPDKNMLSALATNLRALRKAKGWSQADLAQRTDVHLTHISRVELGIYMPGLDFALKAARALEVTVEALISNPEHPLADVHIADLDMAQRLKLLQLLDPHERDALFTIIDAFLTKHRIRQFLDQNPILALTSPP